MKAVLDILQELQGLFTLYGQDHYEEACTQQSHAEQCATLAWQQGCDEETQIAAFLHDIGHFVAKYQHHPDFTAFGLAAHASLGACYLKELGFSCKVVALVQGHVLAKRYLLSVDKQYRYRLSKASRETAIQQGGTLSETEILQFESSPWCNEMILLRRFDDHGKDPALQSFKSEYWFSVVAQHLAHRR
ncbi:HD domain-containing protein [Pseudoalteromonas xiamenensis]|uniref:HD domain-containing protein n=1 Tax=Pseudoalteromonas xiamenensis TaxID=882626 RepID=UPI0027E520EC|nr:HD domain-containing protein [Pseudoalteromonas xiamenensis]WMN59650.1 HD domain-containing protein [Pseudoalteromonas xiamenensis]